MRPVWLLVAVAVAVVGVATGAVSQCLEHPRCQEVNSESGILDCIQLCRSDLATETPTILQHLPPSDSEPVPPLSLSPSFSSSSPHAKRSYSMEHFRWGKPVGRKRHSLKIYTSNGEQEESAEGFPGEMTRRQLASKMTAAEDEEKAEEVAEEEQEQLPGDVHEKKDGGYKMKHFRWSGPPASKRYGGQRPPLTVFKKVANKDGQEEEEREQ